MIYIIIGAMDGVSFDNIFEKLTKDDVALFVEPIPHQFNKLMKNVEKLPCRVYLENCVVSDRVEDIVMAYIPDEQLRQDFLGGCSSVVKFGIPLNRYLSEIKNLSYHEASSVTFDMLCEKYGFPKVDYVQIDCEGYDQVIVDSIDLKKYSIKKLKFETHYLTNDFIEYFSNKWKSYKPTIIEADIIYEYTI
jgi:FkbM family methyltransferase